MRIKAFLYAGVAGIALVATGALATGAQAQTLTGAVSSAEEGAMEGVLVSAKKAGSTITTTVVSNDKGQYSFPAGRLEPGHYTLTIRAAGYTLAGPKEVEVAAGGASADLKLAKVTGVKNVQAQLSNAEWLMSAPGADQIKSFLPDCVGCHTLQRVYSQIHTPDEWKQVFTRMGRYAPESVPTRPQLLLQGGPRSERPRVPAALMDKASEYLTNANVRNTEATEGFNFTRLPRPKGRATHVIITEYDLPRPEALPHDVIVDADGHAWYSDFGNQFVGELDPKTGKVQDYALETLRQDQPKGPLGMEFDPEGNIWVGMSYQAGATKIDRKTKQITTYPLPKEWQGITSQTNMVTPTHMNVDGKVWMEDTENGRVFRLDLASGKWEDRGVATTREGRDHPRLRPAVGQGQQPLSDVVRRHPDRQARRQDQRRADLENGIRPLAAAPRPVRRPEPAVVRRICREPHRHVRSGDRADQGMEAADGMERSPTTSPPPRARPKCGPARC